MKKRTLTIQSTIVLLCVGLYGLHYAAETGRIPSTLFASLHHAASLVTDLKFRLRGTVAPSQRIAIVEIDGASIQALGRWPWPRDYVALLVDKIFKQGARLVALDILFSEPHERVPEDLKTELEKRGLAGLSLPFEDDAILETVFRAYSDRLVSSWASEAVCQPRFSSSIDCPVDSPEARQALPQDLAGAIASTPPKAPRFQSSPLYSAVTVTPNIERFRRHTRTQGFVNSFRDRDGLIRHSSLVLLVDGRPYPSFPLEIARRAMGDTLQASFTAEGTLSNLSFSKRESAIVTSPTGVVPINFRGPSRTFTYVSAKDLLIEKETRGLASQSESPLKDAVVLVGLTALAVGDILPTPLDPISPGVEVNATLVDNLMTGDTLRGVYSTQSALLHILGLILLGTLLGWGLRRFEIFGAIAMALGLLVAVMAIDFTLFRHQINAQSAFYYFEWILSTSCLLFIKYLVESNQKRFLRTAFSKYVAPSVVESLIRNPEELSLGGRKEELTILFSDIRDFTPFSEKRDARLVSQFLNEYLDLMTEVVFSTQGTVDKYIGDAVMAFWGAPLPQADHAERACRSALRMSERLATAHAEFRKKYELDLRIGIGFHSGTVSVGNMGSSKSLHYTVIGDNVNLASRIEGLTKKLKVEILMTQATLDAIPKATLLTLGHTRELGSFSVKGRNELVQLHEIRNQPYDSKGLETYRTALTLFQAEKWKDAQAEFQKASALLEMNEKKDGPTEYYLEECARVLKA